MVEERPGGETDPAELSYEQAVESLEAIIAAIEDGSVGLEQSIEAYRRGTALIRRCKSILDQAEREITEIEASDADSTPGPAADAE